MSMSNPIYAFLINVVIGAIGLSIRALFERHRGNPFKDKEVKDRIEAKYLKGDLSHDEYIIQTGTLCDIASVTWKASKIRKVEDVS